MSYLRLRAVTPRCEPIRVMTKELRQQKKTELAVAIAQGKSVDLWARVNHVPRSTAYRWAGHPDVQATSEACRRCAENRALRKMANRAYWASYHVAALARDAESEHVQLRALTVDRFRRERDVQAPSPEAPHVRD